MQVGLNRLVQEELARHVPECRAFYASRGERRGPASLEELRAARAAHVPGGGFYLGSTAGGDTRNLALAESLGIAVISVDYRLAPEDPWPAAPDDCEAAALWLIDRAEVRFGTANLAIGGSSAGATLAMTTLLRLRDKGHAGPFAGAALQFGSYDLSGQTAAGRLIADEYFLEAYVGHVADRTVPDVSPVFGGLRDLPPTLLVVGALDVLLEDNLARRALQGGRHVPMSSNHVVEWFRDGLVPRPPQPPRRDSIRRRASRPRRGPSR